MKILILATDIYTRGGIARYTWTLASALGDLAGPDNVHVLALLGARGSLGTPKNFRVLGTVTERLTAATKLQFAGKALGLGRGKYDLIVCTFVGLAPVAAVMRLLFGTPYWVTCHGIEAWRRLPPDERLALRHADRVIPISRFTAEKIAKVNDIPREKISVLYNAIPDEFAALLTSQNGASAPGSGCDGRKRLLSVGVLSKAFAYKGFDTVIRAMPQVVDAFPNAHYVVAGDGDDRENLRKLAVDLGVGQHVDFAGEVSDAALAALYRACDVFVLPSRVRQVDGHWQGEGFGRVYVEAALARKPVVGSWEGGAAEAVLDGKTGLLVDPTSVSDVAGALITLLRSAELAEKMGHEGQRWARENFTEGALRKQLREMLGSAPGTRQEETSLCAESSE